ncbi:glycosyl hydrolase, family 43 [Melioribacter roseus P3M-2]|uniref:Glycosyl hydrolase, family 43 n=1 Tax=Melioribacter roseus (strain DSM 23840 / JCM 17771 / VKM B-2668 / P3M-2) TaxID=1191523 RepID=I6YXL6_MELRP|nr:glycoside hydrolase 43 family protein [Melioribacter roseus]AFN75317.1 glycosyl hydrolase, family 43 [Melioribacter roseus P3M-2]
MRLYKITLFALIVFGISNINLPGQTFIPRQSDSTICTWHADNGNGTFTNPIFYEEFSDPDLIRVGSDYYMTGTTMHTMPGLPVLHSKDLVNWKLLGYACRRLDLGPEFRLEEGKEIYGQGFWAPCIRYHNGMFFIFSNVNRHKTQVFKSTDPAGPWEHYQMNVSLHDLSVLFDDDGKVYVVWGYDEIRIAELNAELTDTIPGSGKIIIPAGSGAGEGCHFYKIDGKYYITITNWDPVCYQVCARADNPYGLYEINVMSAEENMGMGTTWRLWDTKNGPPFNLIKAPSNHVGCIPMHQGGIVETDRGEWWGFSMMDYNSIGRVTVLSPVTWKDGWPYMGLPGNLKCSPKSWRKPLTSVKSGIYAPFEKDDNFDGPELKNAWQWNHATVDEKWSLNERKGFLRLHSLPAESFWYARNTLTQRAVGPESYAVTLVDISNLKRGDIAGLALLNLPYAWIGITKNKEGDNRLQYYNQQKQKKINLIPVTNKIWLRAYCNFDEDFAYLSYSTDGENYITIDDKIILPYQLKTFQGVRYALFNFNKECNEGGFADFDFFEIIEPRCKGLTRPIPYNKTIKLISLADSTILVNWKNFLRPVPIDSKFAEGENGLFRVIDRGEGRIALQSIATGGYVTVKNFGEMAEVRIETEGNGSASTFQWIDMLKGEIMLMSLKTHKYLFADPYAGSLCSADSEGARPDRKGGSCFIWVFAD